MQTVGGVLLTAAALGSLLAGATPSGAQEPKLSLVSAVTEALASNPDLAAQRRGLAADREEVSLARSVLLPQVQVGGTGQVLDSERAAGNRGNSTKESLSAQASVSQILYDEDSWAAFQAQQHTFDQQQEQYEEFRLGIAQEAALAFFSLDQSLALLQIQQTNRELTLQNLETTRARVATGVSSSRELLRWQSQLAQNEIGVEQERTFSLSNRFELNRVRSRPREEAVDPVAASVDAHGFVYARDAISQAILEPEGDRKLRDYLVRVGIGRSPTVRAIDAALLAQERILTAKRRAFWVPSLGLSAGVDHLVNSGSGSGSFNETEYGVSAQLSFPVFAGGAKPAGLRQASEGAASLRLARRSQVETLGQEIRASFAEASGAYRSVAYAEQQKAAATKNFELVYESYQLGVASYLDLLDAQDQGLTAQTSYVNALYSFLTQLVEAETQIAFFPFLEDPTDVETVVQGLERAVGQP